MINRRKLLMLTGAVSLSGLSGCMGSGEEAEIEYTGTSAPENRNDPVFGLVSQRINNFEVTVPPETRGSIEINLSRGAISRLFIRRSNGTGTARLFSQSEYERWDDGDTASGYALTATESGSSHYIDELLIESVEKVLVVTNHGEEGTDTEEPFEAEVGITERLDVTDSFQDPVVETR